MTRPLPGIIQGKMVELSVDPGMDDGQEVEVILRARTDNGTWGDGLRRCAGALAESWTDEDDRILEQIHRERQADARPEIEG